VTLIQAQVYQPARMVLLKAMQVNGWLYSANPDETLASGDFTACGDMTNPLCCGAATYYECPNTETRHNNGGNVSYADGHASWLSGQVMVATDAAHLTMWNNAQ
jgi:prepilin-type processing-associated H-X9-DG protein